MDPKPADKVWRGKVAWHMKLIDVLIGHNALGFDYVMNGDLRPNG